MNRALKVEYVLWTNLLPWWYNITECMYLCHKANKHSIYLSIYLCNSSACGQRLQSSWCPTPEPPMMVSSRSWSFSLSSFFFGLLISLMNDCLKLYIYKYIIIYIYYICWAGNLHFQADRFRNASTSLLRDFRCTSWQFWNTSGSTCSIFLNRPIHYVVALLWKSVIRLENAFQTVATVNIVQHWKIHQFIVRMTQ